MMQDELQKNSIKGDFLTSWVPSLYELTAEVNWHLVKWHHASMSLIQDPGNIELRHLTNEYAVDVANYMMKSSYHYGIMLLDTPIPAQK
jgi:hypothetical protein